MKKYYYFNFKQINKHKNIEMKICKCNLANELKPKIGFYQMAKQGSKFH